MKINDNYIIINRYLKSWYLYLNTFQYIKINFKLCTYLKNNMLFSIFLSNRAKNLILLNKDIKLSYYHNGYKIWTRLIWISL